MDWDKMFLIARAVAVKMGSPDPEAVAQEALIKLYLNGDQARNPEAYVTTIAKNLVVEHWRSRKCVDLLGDTPVLYEEHGFEFVEFMADIERLFSELSEEYRTVLLLRAGGLRMHEIADELGIPLGTVKSRLSFARAKLRGRIAV